MSNLSGHGQLTGVMRTGGGGGGGGSEVIINPSGVAIGTMEKISVDGDIYEVRNVPDATSASNGDVLTRSASGVGWYPPTKELPVFTSSDNNKVLAINNDTLTWETIPKELPTITTSDEGKVLGISNGVPTWTTSGGGGGGSFIDTTNLIYTTVSSSNFDTYTAEYDCYIMADVVCGNNTSSVVKINNSTMSEYFFSDGTVVLSFNSFLKAGQTLTISHGKTADHTINVYGIN